MTDEHDTPREDADEGGGPDQGEVEPVGSVPGIDEDASVQLAIAGVATVDELVAADPADLADRTDLPESTVREWQDAAAGPAPDAADPGPAGGTEPPPVGDPAEGKGSDADPAPPTDPDPTTATEPDPTTATEPDPTTATDPGPAGEEADRRGAEPASDHQHPEAEPMDDHATHPEAEPMDDHEAADPAPEARGHGGHDRKRQPEGSTTPPGADAAGSPGGAREGEPADGPDVTPVDDASTGNRTLDRDGEVTIQGDEEASPGQSGEASAEPSPTEDELEREILGIDDVTEKGEVFCHECGATIDELAEVCPECGARQEDVTGAGSTGSGAVVREESTSGASGEEKNATVAAGLSLLLPGAGQAYNGQYLRGAVPFGAFVLALGLDLVVLFLFVFIGLGLIGVLLAFLVIGVLHLVLHGGAAYDAHSQAGKINAGEVSVD